MSEDTYEDKEYEEDVSATSISDGFTRAQTILFGNGKLFRCDVKAAKDPFLPVTTPMIDRCNFPLPPLSIYCPQYQYREMCKSDIWSYYALSFYM